jgi:hypothetical protein
MTLLAAALASGGAAAATLGSAACITAPPPDLPQPVAHRPTILHDAVVPPPDQILAQLPDEFVVPVELDDPNQGFTYDVFVDFDPIAFAGRGTPPAISPTGVSPSQATVDGGIALVTFTLDPSLSGLGLPICHTIQFLVAHQFNATSPHTWDAVGGDLVQWFYNPVSGVAGCPAYDAGALQDGAFPDAPFDGIPVVPEGGGIDVAIDPDAGGAADTGPHA